MHPMAEDSKDQVRRVAGDIVAAYLSNNQMPPADVPAFIRTIKEAVADDEAPPAANLKPAVPIKQSVKPNVVVCLECGAEQKMLKRHVSVSHGLTEAEYKEKWGLPKDYPLVAPSYAKQRSALAKKIGLGRKGRGKKK